MTALDERDFNRVLADSTISSNANRFIIQVSQDADGYAASDSTIEALMSFPAALGIQNRSAPTSSSIKYDTQTRRWSGIPPSPRRANDLFEPLMNIINTLLHFSEIDMIMYLKSHDTSRLMDNGSSKLMKTHLQLIHFGFMSSLIGRKVRPGARSSTADQMLLDNWQQMADYSTQFVSEVCLDRDIKQGREWLMVYAKERLMHLRNERWCLCILFTETTLEVYSLDRMGIYSSTIVKYHNDPVLFAQAVLGFASDSIEKVEATFDSAIHFEKAADLVATTYSFPESFTIDLPEKIKVKSLSVTATISATPGELQKIYEEASKYESTHPILPDLFVHIRPKYRGHPQKLWKNNTAPIQHPAEHPLPRTPMKMTLMPVTKTLTEFESKKILLSTIADCIKAHKTLYDNGILHGDITPKKMSYTSGKDDGAVLMCEIER